jgi:hypothetical protein
VIGGCCFCVFSLLFDAASSPLLLLNRLLRLLLSVPAVSPRSVDFSLISARVREISPLSSNFSPMDSPVLIPSD